MTTKIELEKENELLREIASGSTNITACTFTGSSTDAQCEAVREIAIALQFSAKALMGAPAIIINNPPALD